MAGGAEAQTEDGAGPVGGGLRRVTAGALVVVLGTLDAAAVIAEGSVGFYVLVPALVVAALALGYGMFSLVTGMLGWGRVPRRPT